MEAVRIAGLVAARPRGVRRVDEAALPLVHSSPEGLALLAAKGRPRALALGAPRRSCPARAAGVGGDLAAATRAALSACFAELAAAGADPACGCEALIVGEAALSTQAAFNYAPGVSARLVSPDLGLDLDMAAAEEAGEDGARRLVLRPAPGGEAVLRVAPDGTARMRFAEAEWTGRREAEGLSRGRYRERFAMTRADGAARLVLSAGWEPLEYALARDRLERPVR
ncbi:MAG: hypothetical protein AAGI51_06865 [Pseudomonadota bacterium]